MLKEITTKHLHGHLLAERSAPVTLYIKLEALCHQLMIYGTADQTAR